MSQTLEQYRAAFGAALVAEYDARMLAKIAANTMDAVELPKHVLGPKQHADFEKKYGKRS